MISVGSTIRKKRKELGMTQDDLAKATGYVSKAFISDIERGKAPLPVKKIPIFKRILGIDEGQLVTSRRTIIPLMPGPKGEDLSDKSPGEIVKIYRQARDLSVNELARGVAILTPEKIVAIEETGNIKSTFDWAVPICHFLGIPEKQFIKHIWDYYERRVLSLAEEKPENAMILSRLQTIRVWRAEHEFQEATIYQLYMMLRETVNASEADKVLIKDLKKSLNRFKKKAEQILQDKTNKLVDEDAKGEFELFRKMGI